MKSRWTKTALALTGIAVIGFAAGTALRLKGAAHLQTETDYLTLFSQVKALVKQKYVENVDEKKLMEGAVTGMLSALDPHSTYLPPEYFKEMNIAISGSFAGLGIEINLSDGKLMVIAPIDDTPAFRAGIKPGDFIWKIDNSFTRDLNINEAVNRMRGPKGTGVTLTILRKNSPRPLVFKLVRDIINTKSLKSRMLEPGYGYIRIAHFQARTEEDFVAALAALRRQNGGVLRGLVIDLRNNPGGLLESAVAVAGRFIDTKEGSDVIVSTNGREPASRMVLTTPASPKEPHYPVAVLINGGSASASEIVAGALQDHNRAVIIGTPSFGKGSVQTVFPLPGGAGLKLTTARYYTPKGRSIQAKGITPDILVENDVVALVQKKELTLHEKDLENHITDGLKSPKDHQTPLPPQPAAPTQQKSEDAKDAQLFRAVALLKGIDLLGRAK